MIGKLTGIVDWKGDGHVILDVRGVGYEITVSDRTSAALAPVGQAPRFIQSLWCARICCS